MKNIFLKSFILVSFLFACNKDNTQLTNVNNPTSTNSLKKVRYETAGSIPYDILYTNQTGSWNTKTNQSGNWVLEFQCQSGKLLSLKAETSNSIKGNFSSKIYIDGLLWMDASGDVTAACQDWCP